MTAGTPQQAIRRLDTSEPVGEWSVWQHAADGTPDIIEGDLPEEVARQMVANYAAEGETVWMNRITPAPEWATYALSAG